MQPASPNDSIFSPVPPCSELLERKHTHTSFFFPDICIYRSFILQTKDFFKGGKALGGEERIFLKKNNLLCAGFNSLHENTSVSQQSKRPCLKSTLVHHGKLVCGGGCVFSKAHFIKTLQEDRHNNSCKATGTEAQRQTQYSCG